MRWLNYLRPISVDTLVDAGLVGSHDVGVSQRVANATLVRRFGNDWSLDATVSYMGERWADTANSPSRRRP